MDKSTHFATKEDAERGHEFQVVDDAGDLIDWYITVQGADSKAYRDLEKKQRHQVQEKAIRTRRAALTPDEADKFALALTCAATKSWRGADALAEFSAESVRQVYVDYPSVRDQAAAKIHDRSNFLPVAATSS